MNLDYIEIVNPNGSLTATRTDDGKKVAVGVTSTILASGVESLTGVALTKKQALRLAAYLIAAALKV